MEVRSWKLKCNKRKIIFYSLSELVQHEKNGFVFENDKELAEQLISWFHEYPQNISLVNIKEIFQQNLRQFQMLRWNENWNKHALPLFRTEWYTTVLSYAFRCLRYFCLNTFFLNVSVMLKNDCFVLSVDLSLGELWRNGWRSLTVRYVFSTLQLQT